MKPAYKTWNEFFDQEKNEEYTKSLHTFLDNEYSTFTCYPPRNLLFNAFKLTPLSKVKIVIIGQDPYHEPDQAMGLSFSVPNGVKVPPSLINIYKEIEDEFNVRFDKSSGDLTYLAEQGVLLLNSILSVRAHEPMSHNIEEYDIFFEKVLDAVDRQNRPIVYMLWGNSARKFARYIHNPTHLVLYSVHPSPLSANRGGWFGNNHFKKANEYLIKEGCAPIDWIKR